MFSVVQFRKDALAASRIVSIELPELAANAVRLCVETFAITANNVTYAVIGDMFGYWNFFPAEGGWGVVPVWGHARVEASNHADVAVGERVYGYLPMATHLDVSPSAIVPGGFFDISAHRQPMSRIYNQYSRLAADPEHDPEREDARMIFGPLFKTGFLIEAFMRRQGWFGAEQVVLTSASSKTALALAHCVREDSPGIRRIGLTSAGNIKFVCSTGLYDEVLDYAAIEKLAARPSVAVDFAGNAKVGRGVHTHLGGALKYSCSVGLTHVEGRTGSSEPLPGPAPTLFFAPAEAAAAVEELGTKGFSEAIARSWQSFVSITEGCVSIDHRTGIESARDAFLATLKGETDPADGIVVRPAR